MFAGQMSVSKIEMISYSDTYYAMTDEKNLDMDVGNFLMM